MFEQSIFKLHVKLVCGKVKQFEAKIVYSTLCPLFELHYASAHEKICLWFKTLPLLTSLIQFGLDKLHNKSYAVL